LTMKPALPAMRKPMPVWNMSRRKSVKAAEVSGAR